ncbi:hypothetical protein ACOSP7_006202 [Xanthoceras sorbifolium]
MAIQQYIFLFCILASVPGSLATTHAVKPSHYSMPFNRTIFPAGFIFGAGSASYQVQVYGILSLRITQVYIHNLCIFSVYIYI